MIRGALKTVNTVLAPFGAKITRADTGGWSIPNLRRGFGPATLIDVGVAHGTPQLYNAFPDAYLVLIEPLDEFTESINNWLASRRGEHVRCALGATEGTLQMSVEHNKLSKSSLVNRDILTAEKHGTELREVSILTLDQIVASKEWAGPFGLKIDTEGYELEVVRGATKVLRECQFVIAEVSGGPRFTNSYRFAEFIAAMHENGFDMRDILTTKRFRDGNIAFMDMLFTPVKT